MANEKIHEYTDACSNDQLINNKVVIDCDVLDNNDQWVSMQLSADTMRSYILHFGGMGLQLLTLTNNEILSIQNPQIGSVVFNLDHDTICFYAANGWQRLNHQPM